MTARIGSTATKSALAVVRHGPLVRRLPSTAAAAAAAVVPRAAGL